MQQLLPAISDGGSITLVSSVGARSAVPNLAAYSATKGALDTLVKHFAAALGPRGIRVNAIAPGVIDTDMSSFSHTENGRKLILSIQALQRIATPDDISGVFAFLASDAARWITGQVISVDGGTKALTDFNRVVDLLTVMAKKEQGRYSVITSKSPPQSLFWSRLPPCG